MRHTTVGQLLLNDALPEDMRDYDRVMDKPAVAAVLREVAQRYPERYREISFKFADIGRRAAQESGGYSVGIQHLRKSKAGQQTRDRITAQVDKLLDDDSLDDKKREELILRAVGREIKPQQEAVFAEAQANENPLAHQILSGARGNKMNLASLIGTGDLLYTDHRNRPIPIPVLRNYTEGLSPEEYWAGAYGARKGVIDLKMATQEAGFLGKQLNQVAHRLVVVGNDYEDPEQAKILRGIPVDVDDKDNEGSLLARDTGPYKRNTVLTPKMLHHLEQLGHQRLLVRSAMTGGSPDGGVYARDVGVREQGGLPGRGEQVGMNAAQALSEPLTQAQISSKHTGGVAGEGAAISGFDYINQLIQVPKKFRGGAAHSTVDGTVQRIEPAPAGGTYVTINDEQHYVHKDYPLKVKKGDKVEAGDVISEGIPNPAVVTQHKGIGEGRRYFAQAMRDAFKGAGLKHHRRNIELLARGVINHVRLTDEHEDFVPGDVVPYSALEHTYRPRDGHRVVHPRDAVGKYLEAPTLHYTIGTQVRPSMLKDFDDFGVQTVVAHDDPPPFEPEMIRGMANLQHDPDWLTRMYGSELKKGLLDAVHRGGTSDPRGTSFVPALAQATTFGQDPQARVRTPGPPTPVDGPDAVDALDLHPFDKTKKKPKEAPRFSMGLNIFRKAAEEVLDVDVTLT